MSATYTPAEIVFLLNPNTGSVDTLEAWRTYFESMSAEEWGSESFEGAGLIEVVQNDQGEWIEKN